MISLLLPSTSSWRPCQLHVVREPHGRLAGNTSVIPCGFASPTHIQAPLIFIAISFHAQCLCLSLNEDIHCSLPLGVRGPWMESHDFCVGKGCQNPLIGWSIWLPSQSESAPTHGSTKIHHAKYS